MRGARDAVGHLLVGAVLAIGALLLLDLGVDLTNAGGSSSGRWAVAVQLLAGLLVGLAVVGARRSPLVPSAAAVVLAPLVLERLGWLPGVLSGLPYPQPEPYLVATVALGALGAAAVRAR